MNTLNSRTLKEARDLTLINIKLVQTTLVAFYPNVNPNELVQEINQVLIYVTEKLEEISEINEAETLELDLIIYTLVSGFFHRPLPL
jgi:hypothetical protein